MCSSPPLRFLPKSRAVREPHSPPCSACREPVVRQLPQSTWELRLKEAADVTFFPCPSRSWLKRYSCSPLIRPLRLSSSSLFSRRFTRRINPCLGTGTRLHPQHHVQGRAARADLGCGGRMALAHTGRPMKSDYKKSPHVQNPCINKQHG